MAAFFRSIDLNPRTEESESPSRADESEAVLAAFAPAKNSSAVDDNRYEAVAPKPGDVTLTFPVEHDLDMGHTTMTTCRNGAFDVSCPNGPMSSYAPFGGSENSGERFEQPAIPHMGSLLPPILLDTEEGPLYGLPDNVIQVLADEAWIGHGDLEIAGTQSFRLFSGEKLFVPKCALSERDRERVFFHFYFKDGRLPFSAIREDASAEEIRKSLAHVAKEPYHEVYALLWTLAAFGPRAAIVMQKKPQWFNNSVVDPEIFSIVPAAFQKDVVRLCKTFEEVAPQIAKESLRQSDQGELFRHHMTVTLRHFEVNRSKSEAQLQQLREMLALPLEDLERIRKELYANLPDHQEVSPFCEAIVFHAGVRHEATNLPIKEEEGGFVAKFSVDGIAHEVGATSGGQLIWPGPGYVLDIPGQSPTLRRLLELVSGLPPGEQIIFRNVTFDYLVRHQTRLVRMTPGRGLETFLTPSSTYIEFDGLWGESESNSISSLVNNQIINEALFGSLQFARCTWRKFSSPTTLLLSWAANDCFLSSCTFGHDASPALSATTSVLAGPERLLSKHVVQVLFKQKHRLLNESAFFSGRESTLLVEMENAHGRRWRGPISSLENMSLDGSWKQMPSSAVPPTSSTKDFFRPSVRDGGGTAVPSSARSKERSPKPAAAAREFPVTKSFDITPGSWSCPGIRRLSRKIVDQVASRIHDHQKGRGTPSLLAAVNPLWLNSTLPTSYRYVSLINGWVMPAEFCTDSHGIYRKAQRRALEAQAR